jgi:hypothetical protein
MRCHLSAARGISQRNAIGTSAQDCGGSGMWRYWQVLPSAERM